jgi:hypothetical protein
MLISRDYPPALQMHPKALSHFLRPTPLPNIVALPNNFRSVLEKLQLAANTREVALGA